MTTTLDPDAEELWQHFQNGKDLPHALKCLIISIAEQLGADWSAEECRDHLHFLAEALGALEL